MRLNLRLGSSGMLDDETQERRGHSDLMRKAEAQLSEKLDIW